MSQTDGFEYSWLYKMKDDTYYMSLSYDDPVTQHRNRMRADCNIRDADYAKQNYKTA